MNLAFFHLDPTLPVSFVTSNKRQTSKNTARYLLTSAASPYRFENEDNWLIASNHATRCTASALNCIWDGYVNVERIKTEAEKEHMRIERTGWKQERIVLLLSNYLLPLPPHKQISSNINNRTK